MDDQRARRLHLAGLLFAVGSAIHLFDHLRRGQGSVTETLYWMGNLALVLQVTVVVLVLTRHHLAPLAAASAGIPLAVGFAGAHWLPEWSGVERPCLGDRFVDLVLRHRVHHRDRGRARRRVRGSRHRPGERPGVVRRGPSGLSAR